MPKKPTYEELEQRVQELEQTEKTLRESEERFRLAFHTNPDSINLNRASDGMYIDINEGFTNIMGYTREDIIGKASLSLNIWKNPKDRERLIDGLSKTGYVENLEAQFVGKEGKIRVGLMSARILRIGGENVILSITRDITKIKKAEEELRESEKKYRILFDMESDALSLIEIETGKMLDVNKAFIELYGYSKKEILRMKNTDFSAEPEMTEQATQARGTYVPIRYHKKKEGTVFPTEITARIFKYQGRNVHIAAIRDITERKRLEAQLQHAQKMEAIGTLAGGIAHDFNNLLMGIQGRSSLILLDTDSSHPHNEHLKGIENYVKSAAELTTQLLAFARGGKYKVKPEDLNKLVKDQNRMFGRTKKEVTIRGKYEKSLWSAEVDKGQIEQVLLNLYVNAWQSMPGGGNLYIQTENITLDEKYPKSFKVNPGKYVKISVTDTGVGMDEATQRRIFDPFYTTKEMGRGTGLGLASAYGIIKNHGGFIDVYSEKGEGSTFNIYLPASDKEVVREVELLKYVLKGTGAVLLVDDEDLIIDVGKPILEKLGYNTLIARSGMDAIEIYKDKKDQIDLVILDMIMPEMGGGDTYDKLRKINPEVKVLLSSGYSINGLATEILEQGCNGFIQKPFSIKALSQKIREILDKNNF